MIIAIDGPAGSGKSSTARAVAEVLGFIHLDTGAMYRAVALAFLRAKAEVSPEGAASLLQTLHLDLHYDGHRLHVRLDGEDVSRAIRQPDVGQMASKVATLAAVREKLVAEQRRIGYAYAEDPGVVLEGRDIGTVVFPDAGLKIFMTASPEIRARRRQAELAERGTPVPLDTLLREIEQRDQQDSQRSHSPLRQADDAIVLDTTPLSLEEQVQFIVNRARERT